MPDFESMTLDELIAFKTDCKRRIEAVREEARAANEVYTRRIDQGHIDRARVSMQEWANRNGKTLDEAVEYWVGRLDPDTGTTGRWTQALLLQGKRGAVRF